ncbi:MAG: type II toxin-antitoxin system HicA family toxin [Daejeonella sp.]
MSRQEKLLQRLLTNPRDFTWDELIRLLTSFGYEEHKTGKTGGSRRKFINQRGEIISLHKPHPGNIIKQYVIRDIIIHLSINGHLNDE